MGVGINGYSNTGFIVGNNRDDNTEFIVIVELRTAMRWSQGWEGLVWPCCNIIILDDR